MATITTATLKTIVSWAQTDTESANSLNTITDAGNYLYERIWATGIGYGCINQLWHENKNLTSGELVSYDMIDGLYTPIFGSDSYKVFTNIRGIIIENTSAGTGTGIYNGVSGHYNCDIAVKAIGANGFSGLFNGQSGNYRISARSPFILINYATGWPLAPGRCVLTLQDVGCGSGSSYRILIVGQI